MTTTHTPMADFARRNQFDDDWFAVAQALHWFCVNNHDGQWSDLYRIQCGLDYRPARSESAPDEDSYAASAVTEALEAGELDPQDVADWIHAVYEGHHD